MITAVKNVIDYRELLLVLTWKNVTLKYKQSYLGLMWLMFRPLILVGIFMVVRSFVGIDSGDVPYALLTYCAMVPWAFFQEAATDGVGSVVNHASLIKKIYFPRELFPLASLFSKFVDLVFSLVILGLLMAWFGYGPTTSMIWAPILIFYTMLTALTISFIGAALNVYARDMSQAVPLLLSLVMYVSPVMYPLSLVKQKLLVEQIAGPNSEILYFLYSLNPMAGIIDGFQRVTLLNQPPDMTTMLPGLLLILVLLPLSYLFFKRAESFFADVI